MPGMVAEHEMRLGGQAQRHGVPWAPGRFLGGGEARVGRHLLRSGGTHQRPQHGPRRVERCRAVDGELVERGGVEEGRPALCFGGLPGVAPRPIRPGLRAGDAPRLQSGPGWRASVAR